MGLIPGSGRLLEKEMATHSSILAWRIPQQSSVVGYSPWGHKRVRHDWAHTHTHTHTLNIYG